MSCRTKIALALGLAGLYLAAVNDHWAVTQDSGLYLAMGRSLAEGRGMEFSGRQVWALPPVVPFLIAGCHLLVGEHYWLSNLVMTLFGLGVVGMTYLTVRELAADVPDTADCPGEEGSGEGRALRSGLVAAVVVLVGLSARLFVDSTRILTDVPFTFFAMVGLYGFLRGRIGHWAWYGLAAVALALATHTRLPGMVFLGGFALAAVLDSRREGYGRRMAAVAGATALVAGAVLAWFLLIRPHADPGTADHFARLKVAHWWSLAFLWETGQALTRIPSAICGSILGQKLVGLDLAMTALVLVGAWVAARRRQWIVVMPLVLYVGLLIARDYSSIAPRYFLPIMPLLVYCMVLATQRVESWWRRRRAAPPRGAGPYRPWAVIGLVAVCLVVSVPKIAREIYWMRHPDFYSVYSGGQWRGVRQVCEALRERGRPATDEVVTSEPSVVHYLSGLHVAAGPPLWPPEGPRAYKRIPPEDFAQAVAMGSWRFVVMPADTEGWSGPMIAAFAETGAFRPPEAFDHMVLFERLPRKG